MIKTFCAHLEVGHITPQLCDDCGVNVNRPPMLNNWYLTVRYRWPYRFRHFSFRYSTERDPKLGFVHPAWPYRWRWLLWPICVIKGHTGWGTFGYFSCARCNGDWG